MPIYEFYCEDCNTIFSFFSKTVNTTKQPTCPRCKATPLVRRMSVFAVTGRVQEDGDMDDVPFDEAKMERAIETLAREAENIDENDPRQAARLMQRLTDMTGVELGPGMQEAMQRMEAGEDPDEIEAQMGDLLEDENALLLPEKKGRRRTERRPAPKVDETLYDL
ncbi:FmdB family zinc ribbon protein [Thermodesulfobacteriota bacterium]